MKTPTKKQAYQKILKYAKKNDFAHEVYRDDRGRCCAVGVLFSDEQLQDIALHKENRMEISYLYVGVRNLAVVTGLSMRDLCILQTLNDEKGKEAVVAHCRRRLKELP